MSTLPRNYCQAHEHSFHELCLVADDHCVIRRGSALVLTAPGSLLYYRPDEPHGFQNNKSQKPKIWVLHFEVEREALTALSWLREPSAEKRVWGLTMPQAESFKWLFMRISAEHTEPDPCGALAESAWLRLLLVNIQRWSSETFAPPVAPTAVRADTLKLWQMIQDCAGRPADFSRSIHEFPNYNCLRQEFTSVFGCSPSQMALRARIQAAKHLLLEAPLSIKLIAQELGYVRQHEFARAFHRATGVSPTRWRDQPG